MIDPPRSFRQAPAILLPAKTVQTWPEAILSVPERFSGDFATYLFPGYADIPIYFAVLYVILVFVGPEYVMKNRQAMTLKPLVIVWNLFLSVFSILGAMALGPTLYKMMMDRGFYLTTCDFDHTLIHYGTTAFWLFAFLISKIPEMIDTVFLVLQKKPVIFLHWYHHLTVMLFCWHAGQSIISSGLWYATMNYSVHSIMYFYYFMCSIGCRKLVRPIAPIITSLQIIQMVIGTAIVFYTAYQEYVGPGCQVTRANIRFGLVMYSSYFVLFFILFCNLYLKKKPTPAEIEARQQAKAKAVADAAGGAGGSAKHNGKKE